MADLVLTLVVFAAFHASRAGLQLVVAAIFLVGAVRTPLLGWRLCLSWYVALQVFRALLLLVLAVILLEYGDPSSLLHVLYGPWISLCYGLPLAILAAVDLARRRRRDWLHWLAVLGYLFGDLQSVGWWTLSTFFEELLYR